MTTSSSKTTLLSRPSMNGDGFTLLEVIIAMSLTATLMVLVWSLFRTYTKLEERSSLAAVELQLARSFSQQLRSDLEHYAVLPTPIKAPNSSSDQRNEQDRPENAGEEAEIESDTSQQEPTSDVPPEDSRETDSRETESRETESRETVEPDALVVESTSTLTTLDQPTMGMDIEGKTDFTRNDLYRNTFDASLPTTTYLKGSRNRLEFVTRLPYTIDVPTDGKRLSGETRYGTYQLVLYQFNDPKKLETLLQEDPVLNPQRFRPPPQLDPNAPKPVANRLNPNDNIGLIREMKSWLHVTRDRQREELKRQAGAAGLLVNGQLPSADPRFANRSQSQSPNLQSLGLAGADGANSLDQWQPPPEFRHKRDHLPEVTKLQFRYLQQETWQLDWNMEGRLPRAVEVAFDLDPAEPARRAKEFELAHASMLGGQSLQQVLPPPDPEEMEDDWTAGLDTLNTMDLEDPTAIVTEYRFVILLPRGFEPDNEQDRSVRELSR